MQLLEITEHRRSFTSIPVRRKNGDRVFVTGDNRKQLKAVRTILQKLARHFRAPLIEVADFYGLDRINTKADDLLACLSSAWDPDSDVALDIAYAAYKRDLEITNIVLARDPSITQLLIVKNNQLDWCVWWQRHHPSPSVRQSLAQDLVEFDRLAEEVFIKASRQLEKVRARDNAEGN
jgi:hypothetical protein